MKHLKIIPLLLLAVLGLSAFGQSVPQGLPVVGITTSDGGAVVGRSWRTGTRVSICRADGTVDYQTDDARVKARGNSSFNKPKKPLALKFKEPVSVLGMTANRKWILIANFMDHSLLRNALALAAARQTSMAWNPDWRLVNVVENGTYVGCYLMTEEIRTGREWVDTDLDNGFLVELDEYPSDKYRFETRVRKLPVNVCYPKKPSRERVDSIQKMLNDIEDALYHGGTSLQAVYDKYINLDTYADYYIVYELCMNAEPNGPRSCYMFLGRDGKLNAGPVWDFDLAFENMGLDRGGDIRPERFHLKDVRNLTVDSLYDSRALWYDRLLADKSFRNRLSERWAELRPKFVSLADSLGAWGLLVGPSALADQQMWGDKDPARFDNTGSFEASLAHLRKTYLRRIEVLDKLLGK